jgi:GNAT superfamily N-acetyltransferase
MNFRDALVSTYCEDPCRVLPNALWKTLARLGELQTAFDIEQGVVTRLQAWDESILLVNWMKSSASCPAPGLFPAAPGMLMLHEADLRALPVDRFPARTAYFRLLHRPAGRGVTVTPPPGFSLRSAEPGREFRQVAELIGRCYADLHPTDDEVQGWTRHPVFDPALWIWIVDDEKGLPAGLGIAEFDREVREGSLEWIQMLPGYQGRGLGKCLVRELLARLEGRADFTTVSGEVVNATHPEALYRSCGFSGEDVWWLCRASDD